MALHPGHLPGRVADLPRPARAAVPLVLGGLVALGHEPWMPAGVSVFLGLTLACLVIPAGRWPAFRFGWLLGLGYFGVTLRWIIEPFLVDLARHGWMAPFAIVLMAGGLALFWGAAGWCARRVAPAGGHVAVWFALALSAVEVVRGHIFTGFPWGQVSYTLVGSTLDVWLAWVGSYGTSTLIFLVCGITAYGLRRSWMRAWPALVAVGLATIGLQAITPAAPGPVGDATVRVIQPNAPQHQKWDPDWMGVFFDRALAQTGVGSPPDVVIWPETSVPSLLEYADPLFERMAQMARGAQIVAGIQRRQGGDYYNSLVVLEDDGSVLDLYDKAHLVPFGEYIPFADILRPLGLGVLVDQVAGFAPGEGTGLIEIEGLGLTRVLICYEGIFPEDIQPDGPRPDTLLIITNDAWFGTGPGPRQHLVQAQARAIEFGLPVIRSANTGISAVIDARGRIVASLQLNEANVLDAPVPAALPPTLYARTGDLPLWVLLGICMLGGLVLRGRFDVDGDQAHG